MLCKEEKGKSQKCDNRFIGTVDYLILISTQQKTNNNNNILKPGFHMVVSVVYVVSVVGKKFIGQIEFILSRTKSCTCRFFCIEHLYGRFP